MSYSRSRTHNQQKSKRRSRTRLLLIVNGILLSCIVIAAVLVWTSRDDRVGSASIPGESQPHDASSQGEQSPTVSPEPEPSDEDKAAANPSPSSENEYTEPEADSDSITLALVGDILPAARVLDLMKINGYDYPFRGARATLEAADITAGNLESPITERGTPAKDKQYVFRGSADAVPALKEAGFDFLSLANNHTLDYGWEGLSDTMDALDDADLQHAGSGNDDREAFAPSYIENTKLPKL